MDDFNSLCRYKEITKIYDLFCNKTYKYCTNTTVSQITSDVKINYKDYPYDCHQINWNYRLLKIINDKIDKNIWDVYLAVYIPKLKDINYIRNNSYFYIEEKYSNEENILNYRSNGVDFYPVIQFKNRDMGEDCFVINAEKHTKFNGLFRFDNFYQLLNRLNKDNQYYDIEYIFLITEEDAFKFNDKSIGELIDFCIEKYKDKNLKNPISPDSSKVDMELEDVIYEDEPEESICEPEDDDIIGAQDELHKCTLKHLEKAKKAFEEAVEIAEEWKYKLDNASKVLK